jgi:hypothetical protein
MNELHGPRPRWRNAQGGRRAADRHSGPRICMETREEVGRLKTLVETLIAAVQNLTAGQPRP